ncbi:MAG: Co2+/Mg2+ efflux protein ApaG [Zetaproteobacteria bacterium CG12_big_fil_rev_8_21_14_0_65_55_1124]|nr:MAG: Co2+/Mg2+ efflux protein ApaG [Zetaproteobacteria bacterium CG1_02_55_237]PIS19272.1 MAG: Co2+/Mg2+ efflux protein ApaG [Zetaproteobacteria bacterium CG08_land_8_20_14_0_20_55_17]PIW43551.1 MAG: Co2+/Mg2+ efflux protein ApaG [Zetaproteobacteria bacterium CG12_big_fil_rev_8_21_14_0_65_55_1124]PIY54395.1 MAG: Co2+/Mg2+ efflux protein ApaG [Zetaproteobacteria bacterium CG_4_10_14_0_8_um_filter_55_43]PIZ39014.1 MAG: Co2+/Mg2+ efflux protein ApaG [Zetaproteobacteria bacterium CG_4_10_14_0_2_
MNQTTYQINVRVRPEFAEEHSDADEGRFVFIYHVTIHNEGNIAAQLLRRHWVITDADGRVQEVEGEGVIGEQPDIQPGDEHSYQSFCILDTPIGCMQGSYQMRAADGTEFETQIAPFTLAVPGSLN